MSDEIRSPNYRKPPEEYRFRKGQSGNPHGRPKGTTDRRIVLRQQLQRKATILENGKKVRLSHQDLFAKSMVDGAVNGDVSKMRFVLKMVWKKGNTDFEPMQFIVSGLYPKNEHTYRRPKRNKNLYASVSQELQKTIVIEESGNRLRLTKYEAIIRRLVVDAANGRIRAAKLLVELGAEEGEFIRQVEFIIEGEPENAPYPREEELDGPE